MKKFGFRVVLLTFLTLFVCGTSFSVFVSATDTTTSVPAEYSEPDPTQPPDPEPAPTEPASTQPPYSEPEPTQAPHSEPEPTQAPSYEPDPTQEPYYEPDPTQEPVYQAQDTATPRPTSTPAPTKAPATGTVTRPKATLNPGGTVEATTEGSNYEVFARLSTKENALASTMLLGGVVCIALGVLGLLLLLFLFIRNRKRRLSSGTEGIFEEIEQAEYRHASLDENDVYGYEDDGYMDEGYDDGSYEDDGYADEEYADGSYEDGQNYDDDSDDYDNYQDGNSDYADYTDDPEEAYTEYAPPADTNPGGSSQTGFHVIHPEEASMYTADLDAGEIRRAAPPQPVQHDRKFDTMDILLEALGKTDDD